MTSRLLRLLVPEEWRDSIAGDLEEERRWRLAHGRRAGPLWALAAAARVALPLAWSRRRSLIGGRHPSGRTLFMPGLISDVRHAARALAAHRGYALGAILTLALGIGANASVFNLADWLLLRPVPGVTAQGALVTVGFGTAEGTRWPLSVPDLGRLQSSMTALSGLAGYQTFPLHVAPAGAVPERLDADVVSDNYFAVIGGAIAVGRGFDDRERDPGAPPAAVISHRLWQRAFEGRADAIGQPVLVNGEPFTVVGIAVAGFHGATRSGSADLWVPVAQHRRAVPTYPESALTDRRVAIFFAAVGRLAPGATLEQARQQADAVRAGLAADVPNDRRLTSSRFLVTRGIESRPWMVERLSQAMLLLVGFVGLLLLLTCANVANLMLARASHRRTELATRLALGASRRRVVQLLLVESLMLSLISGAAALLLTGWVGHALAGMVVLQGLPPLDPVLPGWRVFTLALLVSVVVALLIGVAPALAGRRSDLTSPLREAGRSHTRYRTRVRRALTVAQVAVSVTLLVGAALLTRSMMGRLAIDPGFDAGRVLSFSVEPGLQGYGPRQEPFYRDLLQRVRELPGVRGAGLAWLRPFSQAAANVSFGAEGAQDDERVSAARNMVSPGFFDAIGLEVVAGRDFTGAEFQPASSGGNGVVILTESLARSVFGTASVVGRRVAMAHPAGVTHTVVGVVRDTRLRRLTEEGDILFEPFGQAFPTGWASVLIRLAAPAEAVMPAVRSAVAELDPALPVYDVVRLDEAIRTQFADELLVARLTVVFAALATLLAAVGLYAMLARSVVERRREIGIRTALGATPGVLAAGITRDAIGTLVGGVAIGLPVSWWLTQFAESRLFGISRLDPVSIGLAVSTIALVSVVSTWAPARRAARTDPAEVLR